MTGLVVALHLSAGHSFSKQSQQQATFIAGLGVDGDAHCGSTVRHRSRVAVDPSQPNLRQVHLIRTELLDELVAQGFDVAPGHLGENVTTAGLNLERMPLGTLIELGPSEVVELTGLRTPCVLIDRFRANLKRQVLSSAETGPAFKSGVLSVVRAVGPVVAGDSARVRLPSSSLRPLPAL